MVGASKDQCSAVTKGIPGRGNGRSKGRVNGGGGDLQKVHVATGKDTNRTGEGGAALPSTMNTRLGNVGALALCKEDSTISLDQET